MPKLKTHKGASRRFRTTGSGKLMRTKQGKSHLRRKKSQRARGQYDEMIPVHGVDRARIQRLVPYGV